MERNNHVSEDERKKGVLIFILIGILVVIMITIVIIMIPKGNNDEGPEYLSSKVSANKDNSNTVKDKEESNRDKDKVTIELDSITQDSAMIVITDENEEEFEWYPKYKLQQKVDDEWKDMEIKNAENMIFPKDPLQSKSGVTTQSIVWVDKYGSLDEGEYRVVKEANGIEFYAEFEIENEDEDEDDTNTVGNVEDNENRKDSFSNKTISNEID